MYIIELFFKIKEKINNSNGKTGLKDVLCSFFQGEKVQDFSPEDEEEKCEHVFSPIDSTNTVLACVKCGFVIHCKAEDLKKKNIFEGDISDNL